MQTGDSGKGKATAAHETKKVKVGKGAKATAADETKKVKVGKGAAQSYGSFAKSSKAQTLDLQEIENYTNKVAKDQIREINEVSSGNESSDSDDIFNP